MRDYITAKERLTFKPRYSMIIKEIILFLGFTALLMFGGSYV
jgi:hypothetical protein